MIHNMLNVIHERIIKMWKQRDLTYTCILTYGYCPLISYEESNLLSRNYIIRLLTIKVSTFCVFLVIHKYIFYTLKPSNQYHMYAFTAKCELHSVCDCLRYIRYFDYLQINVNPVRQIHLSFLIHSGNQ